MTAAVSIVATRRDKEVSQGAFAFAEFEAAAVTMDNSGVQTIVDLDVTGLTRICVQLVVATATLAAFQISAFVHNRATAAVVLKSTTAQFTAPSGVLIDASGDLTGQVAGSAGWFVLNVAGFSTIRLSANSTAGASTLAIFANGV
jgi:hypothetical protein